MIIQSIQGKIVIARSCLRMMAREKKIIICFLFLSLITALTEGVGITMLVPILEVQADHSLFSTVPVFKNISYLFESMDPNIKLQIAALVLGSILILRGVLLYAVEALSGIIPLKIQKELSQQVYSSLLKSEFSFFTKKSIGENLNILTDWGVRVTQIITGFNILVFNMILLILYLSMMMMISWELALAATFFVMILSFVLKFFLSASLHEAGERLSKRNAILNSTTHETMTGMKFIRLSAAEEVMKTKFNGNLEQAIACKKKLTLLQSVTSPFLNTASGLFVCVLLFGIGYFTEGAEEWMGSLLLFLFLMTRLLAPLSQINRSRNEILSHIFVLEQLEQFYKDTKDRSQPTGNNVFTKIQHRILFKDIKFHYPENDTNIIHGLNMEIPAGKMTAIVGPSGSGKSTLLSLLCRFYDVQAGSIKIDDTDLYDFSIQDLRSKISVVSQDVFIFNDTVRNNLAFAVDHVSDADIRMAAKLASADEFIEALPMGYDTILGDRGMRLSGGQQQRIAFARAIIRNPNLLILDEATSNLDTYTEKDIQSAVENLRQDRTIIVIAHRLSTIQKADKVIVLKDGKILEEGTHSNLMSQKGSYWDMVSHQKLDLVD